MVSFESLEPLLYNEYHNFCFMIHKGVQLSLELYLSHTQNDCEYLFPKNVYFVFIYFLQ